MSTTYNAILGALSGNSMDQSAAKSYALSDPVQEILIPPATSAGDVVYVGNQDQFQTALDQLDSFNAAQVLSGVGTPVSTSTSGSSLNPLTDAGSSAATGISPSDLGAQGAAIKASPSGIFASLETWLTSSASNIVAVLIGIVLIAGAVWSFSSVKDTFISTAKGAAELAA